MIRLDTKAGHGAGKPTSKSIEEYTDIFCFLIRALGIQYRQEEGEFLLLLWSDPSG
jgi:prolyl oligopeptidase